MTAITPQFIKGHWFHLVRAVGGTEAAAAYLGCSHQRVSQLQSLQCADLPTLMQVATLEAAVGTPIITGAMSKAISGAEDNCDLLIEAQEVTEAAAALQSVVRKGGDRRAIEAAVVAVQREAADLKLPPRG